MNTHATHVPLHATIILSPTHAPPEPRNRPATSATRATLRGVQTGLDNDLDDEENQRMDHQRKDGGDEDEGIYGMQIEVNDNGNNGNRDGSGGGDDDDNDNDYYGSNTTAGSDNNHNNGSTPQIQFPPTLDPAVKNLHPRRGRRSLKRDADPCKESSPFTIVSAPNQSDVTGCYVQERRYNGEAMYVAQQQQEEGGVDASHGVIGAAQTDPEDRTHVSSEREIVEGISQIALYTTEVSIIFNNTVKKGLFSISRS